MTTALNLLTALATVVALAAEAAALCNFAPVEPVARPQVMQTVIASAADVRRLTKKPSAPQAEGERLRDEDKDSQQ